jgi:hypothetical protein
MLPVVEYLLKLSVGLAVVSLFYYAVLRRLTFYDWNRYYLLLYSVCCFILPLIDAGKTIGSISEMSQIRLIDQIPAIYQFRSAHIPAVGQHASHSPDPALTVMSLVLLGCIFMLVRFGLQVLSYLKVLRNAQLISEDGVKIYHVEKQISPFSFGNAIFYNPEMHRPDELKNIILHEYIHVRQRHSVDILWGELLCILNWYNPFAWLIRHAIRQNLEFIADQKVLESQVDMRQYQYLLLKVAGVPEFRIANQFSFSSLKQRIIMMHKARSNKLFLSVFLLAMPLLAILIVIFRDDIKQIADSEKLTELKTLLGRAPIKADSSTLYISGLMLDTETNEPVVNLPLAVSYNDTLLKMIHTDRNGFYYHEVKLDSNEIKETSFDLLRTGYTLSYDGNKYRPFEVTQNPILEKISGRSGFSIIFLSHEGGNGIPSDYYMIPKSGFFNSNPSGNIEKMLKSYLADSAQKYLAEHSLKVGFRKAHPWPKDVITKFQKGYFNRDKELIGYEDMTQIYLDGKKSDYKAVNEAFRNYPYLVNQTHEYRNRAERGLCKEIFYITFPLHKTAPPAALLKGNIESRTVSEFNLATLHHEPYFLDGFRQTFGVGSNLMPEKKEVRKVVLFKGSLARYYDPKCERIWWIETRPPKEVFERPDLAKVD